MAKGIGAHTVIHLSKDYYQQQSESVNFDNKKIWCTYHISGSHSDDDYHHQRNSIRISTADNESTNDETFIEDSTVTGCDKCAYKSEAEKKWTEIDNESNTPPGIGF